MGQWSAELCVRFPQVCLLHSSSFDPANPRAPRFVVLVSDRDLARKVFTSGAYVKPCIVPIADNILGGDPWVLLDGKAHVDYRKGLNGLFARKALECYLPVQENVMSQYFDTFVAASEENSRKPMPFMSFFREIGCAMSCRTFCGDYISDDAIKRIASDFYCITAALELVNIPFSLYVPYTKAWLGKRAANGVLAEFSKCAAASKIRMRSGAEPDCLVDRWISNMIQSEEYKKKTAADVPNVEKPAVILREFSDFEIAQTLFTFLFASQDASSSSTTYMFQIMAQRPDVLDRVRQENLEARLGDRNGAIGLDMLESLTYTSAVVKEILRYRPPVIFVPYSAKNAFPITPTYTVPKDAMVVPSCYPALHDPEVYRNPDIFDPERWISGNAGEQTKNWMVFGAGPHQCIAQQYVLMTMMAMVGKAALEVDWAHHATKRSDEIKVFATLFPMVRTCRIVVPFLGVESNMLTSLQDDCPMVFTKRP